MKYSLLIDIYSLFSDLRDKIALVANDEAAFAPIWCAGKRSVHIGM